MWHYLVMENEFFISLKSREEIAQDTVKFTFSTNGQDISYKAGQYADFTLIDPPQSDSKGNIRTFSLVGSPNNKQLIIITTRMTGSAFKDSLRELPLGTKVKMSKPMGSFTLHNDTAKPAVFVMGGIGITPIHSIIEFAAQEKLPHKLYLFYSNKTPKTAAFLDDIAKFEAENPNFKAILTFTDSDETPSRAEKGKITAEMIQKYLKPEEITSAIYYISGPPNMVEAMQDMLTDDLKIDTDSIKTEEFSGY